jgi:hypothetical protein
MITLLLRVFLKISKSAATEAEFVQDYILIVKIAHYGCFLLFCPLEDICFFFNF